MLVCPLDFKSIDCSEFKKTAVVSSILSCLRIMNMTNNLQKKQYYTISEVAEYFNIASSVLRYWETQFKQLKPKKVQKRRYYTSKDISVVEAIYKLLYVHKMTIEGARQELLKSRTNDHILLEIKKELRIILDDLL